MENKSVKKTLSKQGLFLILLVVVLIGIGTSFALYNLDIILPGEKANTISTCSVKMNVDEKNPINLVNTYPITDAKALEFTPYTVTVTKGSGTCNTLSYNFTMVNLCDVCTKNDGICTSGSNSINCNSDYIINPELIKYQVVETVSGQEYTGTNPTTINIPATLDTTNTKQVFEIRMWISSTAVNNDMYVSNGSNGYLTNSDGSYITKNYATRLKLAVKAQ